jgi:dihydrofolate synthase/folylpolyglutamate synthase
MSSARTPDVSATLSDWLQYLESIHATAIDMGLDRVREVAGRLGLELSGVKFVVGGTNGKGSTCAMLEAILLAAGYKVGLYTSPHLINFNERARINGQIATDEALIAQFQAVEAARGDVSLTYFEFTTLAILRLFSQSKLDAVVLEVGLGGRLDAVNIVDADCSVVTSVDLDHTDWLGDTREKIGFEKAHIYRSGRPAICSDPMPPQSLLDHVQEIGADLWLFGRDFNYSGDRQQWAYGGREQRRNSLAYPALRGANQLLNASAALAALESVRDRLPVPQQAVRLGLLQASLPGRFQILPRCWRRTWTTWAFIPTPTRCSACSTTRIWPASSPSSARASTTGTAPACRGRAAPLETRWRSRSPPRCRLRRRMAKNQVSPLTRIPPRPLRQRANGQGRMIESWCSARFSP